jgi:hypothetical protein
MPKNPRSLPGASPRKKPGKKVGAPVAGPEPVATGGAEDAPTAHPGPALKAETFDDNNIISDIRKTGIIAGAIFVILVALSMVLR